MDGSSQGSAESQGLSKARAGTHRPPSWELKAAEVARGLGIAGAPWARSCALLPGSFAAGPSDVFARGLGPGLSDPGRRPCRLRSRWNILDLQPLPALAGAGGGFGGCLSCKLGPKPSSPVLPPACEPSINLSVFKVCCLWPRSPQLCPDSPSWQTRAGDGAVGAGPAWTGSSRLVMADCELFRTFVSPLTSCWLEGFYFKAATVGIPSPAPRSLLARCWGPLGDPACPQ